MQILPETLFHMPLYWPIERHVYQRLVLPWQQLIQPMRMHVTLSFVVDSDLI